MIQKRSADFATTARAGPVIVTHRLRSSMLFRAISTAPCSNQIALTWFDWWLREQREGRASDHRDLGTVEADAIFVQLLLGKAVRIERWLAKLEAPHAFKIAAAMLVFTDRLAR